MNASNVGQNASQNTKSKIKQPRYGTYQKRVGGHYTEVPIVISPSGAYLIGLKYDTQKKVRPWPKTDFNNFLILIPTFNKNKKIFQL